MWTELYGPENPYGHMVIGTEPGLKGITRDDLHGFYSSAFTPCERALVLTRDLSESEAKQLANQAFGQWKGSGGAPPLTPAAAAGPRRCWSWIGPTCRRPRWCRGADGDRAQEPRLREAHRDESGDGRTVLEPAQT